MGYFECLRCGVVSPVTTTPPRCNACGHGSGIIHLGEPPKTKRSEGPNENGGRNTDDPQRNSGMLPA